MRSKYSKSSNRERVTYSKSSNRERRLIQNPAREREDLFKIQQEREKTYSKSSKKAHTGGGFHSKVGRGNQRLGGRLCKRERQRERTEEVEDGDDW